MLKEVNRIMIDLIDYAKSIYDYFVDLKPLFEIWAAIIAILGFFGVHTIITIFIKYYPFKAQKEIKELFGKDEIKSLRYYIKTRGQQIDPCERDEIKENTGNGISIDLVSFFVKDAFLDSSTGKYYIVLSDSGMGKTTFLIHLYIKASSKRQKNRVYIIPLSERNCFETISKINDKRTAILLLDAIDENAEAMEDYNLFFQRLITETVQFKRVVVTCRTQFFPNHKAEPDSTGMIHIGTSRKSERFTKIYISPFSDKEISQYLKKKYFFNKGKYNKAYKIIVQTPFLMVRPVILSWIDDFLDNERDYIYTFEIYEHIIDRWIDREAIDNNKSSLLSLSIRIAEYMYYNLCTKVKAEVIDGIASEEGIKLKPIVAKSRSLLNRDGSGKYKFSHSSFYEYFVATITFKNMKLPKEDARFFTLYFAMKLLTEMLVNEFLLHDKESAKFYTKMLLLQKEKNWYNQYVKPNIVGEIQIKNRISNFILQYGQIAKIKHDNDGLYLIFRDGNRDVLTTVLKFSYSNYDNKAVIVSLL